MMNITQQQEMKMLIAALAVLGGLVAYRLATVDTPKTAPLAFPPGSVSSSAVRRGLAASTSDAALNVFLARRVEQFPGVLRDIFRMENPAPRTMPAPVPVPPSPAPGPPQRTAEEIAADLSRAELAKFRFLGYLTEKDSTLFLSKDGELFIVRSSERFLRNYQVKQATAEYVVLLDTATNMERRIALSGSGDAGQQAQQPAQQQTPLPLPPQHPAPQMQRPQDTVASPQQVQDDQQPQQMKRWMNRLRQSRIQPDTE